MKLEKFIPSVEQWAKDRGIIPNATVNAQMGKTLEEIAETWQAIVKHDVDGIKDGIGDVAVTLVIGAYLSETRLHADDFSPCGDMYCKNFTELSALIDLRHVTNDAIKGWYRASFDSLFDVAWHCQLKFDDCLEAAWDEIKDRKGHLDDQGVFHKES